jgi:monofunctional glycosyltransferase
MKLQQLYKVLLISLKIVVGILVAYAVIFSIAFTVAAGMAAYYIGKPVLEVKKLKNANPAETAFMKAVRHQLKNSNSTDTLRQIFIPFNSISPNLKQAVLAAEDDGFYYHPGFDVQAILSAIEYNREARQNRRGASTITQQLAKNMFLNNERSWKRKYLEMAYTVLMEMYLGKDRIYELYLNYAQWGRNVFGCEAAAQVYFHKSASKLTLDESVKMAAALAAPCKVSPVNTTSAFMGKRTQVIANNLFGRKLIGDSIYTSYSSQVSETLAKADSIASLRRFTNPDQRR